jgi:hypothetical protein
MNEANIFFVDPDIRYLTTYVKRIRKQHENVKGVCSEVEAQAFTQNNETFEKY